MDRDKGHIFKKYARHWGITYNISFSIIVDGFDSQNEKENVFHITKGGDCCELGMRHPGKNN